MRTKHKILEILCLIIFIGGMSYAIINIKDLLNSEYNSQVTSAVDIAKTLDEPGKKTIDKITQDVNQDEIVISSQAIAVIDIPAISTRGQVMLGTDDETLKNYIGMFKGSVNPGQDGNFCVAAHNNIYTEIFKNLHNIKVSDKVRVITRDKEYVYIINNVEEILPTQVEVLNSDASKKEITLITCTDLGRTRIAVKGELFSQSDI